MTFAGMPPAKTLSVLLGVTTLPAAITDFSPIAVPLRIIHCMPIHAFGPMFPSSSSSKLGVVQRVSAGHGAWKDETTMVTFGASSTPWPIRMICERAVIEVPFKPTPSSIMTLVLGERVRMRTGA